MSGDPGKLKVFHLADDSQRAEAINRAPAPKARGLWSEA